MKLIWYEIQKIINKQVLIIIAVSLLLNVCIAYLSTENASIDGNAVAEYYEGFQKDPSKADEVWQRLEQMPESVDKNEQYALERYEAQREYSAPLRNRRVFLVFSPSRLSILAIWGSGLLSLLSIGIEFENTLL